MKPKPKKYQQFAFALFDKFGIIPRNGGLAVFEEKHNAEYEKHFYSTFGKIKIRLILITVMDDD